MRIIPRGISWVGPAVLVVGVLLLVLGLRACNADTPHRVPIVVDTASAAGYRTQLQEARAELEAVRGEADGLRGRLAQLEALLRGVQERAPERITVYDTLISLVVDTLAMQSSIDRGGQLTIIAAIPADSGRHQPRRLAGIDVADCDDGIRIIGAAVICDRARLGHLSVYTAAGASAPIAALSDRPPVSPAAELGLHWTPSYRSLWSVTLAATTKGRAELDVRRAFRFW